VAHTAACLAEVFAVSREKLIEQTTTNATNLFKLA
jgi:Tat protein secretion system quality control protein TatD with DNase activity